MPSPFVYHSLRLQLMSYACGTQLCKPPYMALSLSSSDLQLARCYFVHCAMLSYHESCSCLSSEVAHSTRIQLLSEGMACYTLFLSGLCRVSPSPMVSILSDAWCSQTHNFLNVAYSSSSLDFFWRCFFVNASGFFHMQFSSDKRFPYWCRALPFLKYLVRDVRPPRPILLAQGIEPSRARNLKAQ